MLKKLLLILAAGLFSMQMAFAAVDVNKADKAALSGIKGIGPALSEQIIAERDKAGAFKSWDDLEARVSGVANKKSVQLSKAGLTVDGKTRRGHNKKTDADDKAPSVKKTEEVSKK